MIVGIFEIKLEGFNAINVIVMKNGTKKVGMNTKFVYKFDLKGSKINRTSLSGEVKCKDLKSGIILKDLDLTAILNKNPDLINVSITDRQKLVQALQRDSKFLMANGLMDYSMLVAIERTKQAYKVPQ